MLRDLKKKKFKDFKKFINQIDAVLIYSSKKIEKGKLKNPKSKCFLFFPHAPAAAMTVLLLCKFFPLPNFAPAYSVLYR